MNNYFDILDQKHIIMVESIHHKSLSQYIMELNHHYIPSIQLQSFRFGTFLFSILWYHILLLLYYKRHLTISHKSRKHNELIYYGKLYILIFN